MWLYPRTKGHWNPYYSFIHYRLAPAQQYAEQMAKTHELCALWQDLWLRRVAKPTCTPTTMINCPPALIPLLAYNTTIHTYAAFMRPVKTCNRPLWVFIRTILIRNLIRISGCWKWIFYCTEKTFADSSGNCWIPDLLVELPLPKERWFAVISETRHTLQNCLHHSTAFFLCVGTTWPRYSGQQTPCAIPLSATAADGSNADGGNLWYFHLLSITYVSGIGWMKNPKNFHL